MYYELWELDSANMIGTFPSESEALEVVRETIAAYGQQAVESWAMGRVGHAAGRKGASVAEGKALARLALSKAPA